MDTLNIEKCFESHLEKCWDCGDIKSFALAYIQLLFLFRFEFFVGVEVALEERRKQLRGHTFDVSVVEQMRVNSRLNLNRALKYDCESTRHAMINRLVFCALLDTEETDYFYLTEPMFEFVREMRVSSAELKRVLEEEFIGFKVGC